MHRLLIDHTASKAVLVNNIASVMTRVTSFNDFVLLNLEIFYKSFNFYLVKLGMINRLICQFIVPNFITTCNPIILIWRKVACLKVTKVTCFLSENFQGNIFQ